jgi:hypothetical protein
MAQATATTSTRIQTAQVISLVQTLERSSDSVIATLGTKIAHVTYLKENNCKENWLVDALYMLHCYSNRFPQCNSQVWKIISIIEGVELH